MKDWITGFKGVLVTVGHETISFKVRQIGQAYHAGHRFFVFLPKALVTMRSVFIS